MASAPGMERGRSSTGTAADVSAFAAAVSPVGLAGSVVNVSVAGPSTGSGTAQSSGGGGGGQSATSARGTASARRHAPSAAGGHDTETGDGAVVTYLAAEVGDELGRCFAHYAAPNPSAGLTFEEFRDFVHDARLATVEPLAARVFADAARTSPLRLSFAEFLRALGILAVVQFPDTPHFTDAVQHLLSDYVLAFAKRADHVPADHAVTVFAVPSPPFFSTGGAGGSKAAGGIDGFVDTSLGGGDDRVDDTLEAALGQGGTAGAGGSASGGSGGHSRGPSMTSSPSREELQALGGAAAEAGAEDLDSSGATGAHDEAPLLDPEARVTVRLSPRVLKDVQLLFVSHSSTVVDRRNELSQSKAMFWGGFLQFAREADLLSTTGERQPLVSGRHGAVSLSRLPAESVFEAFLVATQLHPRPPVGTLMIDEITRPRAASPPGSLESDAVSDTPKTLTCTQFVQAIGLLAVNACDTPDIHAAEAIQALVASVVTPAAAVLRASDDAVDSRASPLGAAADDETGGTSSEAEALMMLIGVLTPLYRIFHWYTSEAPRRRASTNKLRQQPMAGPLRYATREGSFAVPSINVPALKLAFRKLDVDGSGKLAGRELARIVDSLTKRLSPEAAATWLREVQDAQQGGSGLTFSEFMQSFRQILSKDAHLLFEAGRHHDIALAKSAMSKFRRSVLQKRSSPQPSETDAHASDSDAARDAGADEAVYVVDRDGRAAAHRPVGGAGGHLESSALRTPQQQARVDAEVRLRKRHLDASTPPEELARVIAEEVDNAGPMEAPRASSARRPRSRQPRPREAWSAMSARTKADASSRGPIATPRGSASSATWGVTPGASTNRGRSMSARPQRRTGSGKAAGTLVMTVNQFLEFAREFGVLGTMLSRSELLAVYRCCFAQQVVASSASADLLVGIKFSHFVGALALCVVDALSKHPYDATESSTKEKLTLFLRRLELSGGKAAIDMPPSENLFPTLGLMPRFPGAARLRGRSDSSASSSAGASEAGSGTTLSRMQALWGGLYKKVRPISEYELEADVYSDMFAEMLLQMSQDIVGSNERHVPDTASPQRQGHSPRAAPHSGRRGSVGETRAAANAAARAAGFAAMDSVNRSSRRRRSPHGSGSETKRREKELARGHAIADAVLGGASDPDGEEKEKQAEDNPVRLRMLERIRDQRSKMKKKSVGPRAARHVAVPRGTFGAARKYWEPSPVQRPEGPGDGKRGRSRERHNTEQPSRSAPLYTNIEGSAITVRDYHVEAAERRRRVSMIKKAEEAQREAMLKAVKGRRRASHTALDIGRASVQRRASLSQELSDRDFTFDGDSVGGSTAAGTASTGVRASDMN